MKGFSYVVVVMTLFKAYCFSNNSDYKQEFNPTKNISSECKKAGHCLNYNEYYPSEHIERKVINYKQYIPQAVGSKCKSSSGSNEVVCETTQYEDTPLKVAKSWDNRWYFILNTPSIQQKFTGLECSFKNQPCCYVIRGYESKCIQYEMSRYLDALSYTGELFKDLFTLPSCCICVTKERENANEDCKNNQ